MPNLGFKYYVNPKDIANYSPSQLKTLDKTAEIKITADLRSMCEDEMAHKHRLREAAQGWFYQDPDKMEVANNFEMKACRRLQSLPGRAGR